MLLCHICTVQCASHLYFFEMCLQERTQALPITPAECSAPWPCASAPLPSPVNAPDLTRSETLFPTICMPQRRHLISHEWQEEMAPQRWWYFACTMCGCNTFYHNLTTLAHTKLDLMLLRNDSIPSVLWPSYNFVLCEHAFLCHYGMESTHLLGSLQVCNPCKSALLRNAQPIDLIANHQYYAHEKLPHAIRVTFEGASVHELQLISACRETIVTHMYH